MMRIKKQTALLLLGALTLITFGLVSASAAPVTFAGNTTGSFGAGTSGGTVGGGGTTLTVGGSTITFAPGAINVGLELPPGLNSSTVQLGQFSASSSALSSFNGATFTLNVTFTVPSDALPKPGVYNATVTGQINATASNAVVTWTTTTLTFNSPSVGTFTLTLEPFTPIDPPGNAPHDIRGTITFTNAAIPEPLTIATLGSGLAGLAAMMRRRKKAE